MPRKNISVTIDGNLIKWAKKQVETGKYRSISHVLEYALRRLKQEEERAE